MWGALVRQVIAFVLTKRGKKVIAFVGAMLLCFVALLLADLRLYLTASFTGLLAVITLVAWMVQNLRQKSRERERERRETEEAAKRATLAQARGERMDKARAGVASAARTVSGGAASMADVAKSRLAGARDRLRFWRKKQEP